MITAEQELFGTFLDYIQQELDLPDEVRRDAIGKYDHLTRWFKKDNQERFRTDSDLYPQGSFRLGTVIKPVKDEGDYDLDLVYRRELARESTTQQDLVKSAGEQLTRYIQYLNYTGEEVPTLHPRQRCWRLQYGKKFHMDVLPAIPDDEPGENNIRNLDDAILITDKDRHQWQHSNPRGYADWFDDQQKVMLVEQREFMAKAAKVDVEAIPVEVVKTPLRRAIQLLKRHRDLRYQGDPEDKPISIIITTLAAKAYRNESSVYAAVTSLARNMAQQIQKRDGVYWVPNPVNPNKENFADKWASHPQRAQRFFEWLKQVDADIVASSQQRGLDKVTESLGNIFGKDVAERAMARHGDARYKQREAGKLRMEAGTGILGAVGTQVKGHTFFGTQTQDKTP